MTPCRSAFWIVKHIVLSSSTSSLVTFAVTVNCFVMSSPPYWMTSIGSGESRTKSYRLTSTMRRSSFRAFCASETLRAQSRSSATCTFQESRIPSKCSRRPALLFLATRSPVRPVQA